MTCQHVSNPGRSWDPRPCRHGQENRKRPTAKHTRTWDPAGLGARSAGPAGSALTRRIRKEPSVLQGRCRKPAYRRCICSFRGWSVGDGRAIVLCSFCILRERERETCRPATPVGSRRGLGGAAGAGPLRAGLGAGGRGHRGCEGLPFGLRNRPSTPASPPSPINRLSGRRAGEGVGRKEMQSRVCDLRTEALPDITQEP